jgi:inner membrane protein
VDTLTHTVLGACLGEVIAGKKLGKKAMLIGALANNLPDIDVIAGAWNSPTEGLLVHRGITHSILFALLLPPLLAYFFEKLSKNKYLSYGRWMLLFSSGMFIHIFLDALTAYGTGWFEPFNHARVSFNALFILDPVFMLPMLVAAIVLLILKRTSSKRLTWALSGLIISTLYIAAVSVNKLLVNSSIEKNMQNQHIRYTDYLATPTPLNDFLWYIVARNEQDFYVGYYSEFDSPGPISFTLVHKNDSLLNPFRNSEEVKSLVRFSKGYYCLSKNDSNTVFSEMRFGQIGGWDKENASFVFNYTLQKKTGDAITLQQGRIDAVKWQAIIDLWTRMKGKK